MKLWKMSRTETKRLFSITNITSTLCVSLLIITVCTVTYIRQHGTIDLWFYNMFHEIFCGGYFVELLFIPLGYFVTTNVCTDVTEKVFRLFIARADTYSYIIAKYMIGILFSFVMSMIVLNFFAAVGMSVIPVADEGYYSGGADVYEDLLKRNTFLYFEMRILFASLITSVFAAIGMIFSAVIQNQYVSALSPYLAYTMITADPWDAGEGRFLIHLFRFSQNFVFRGMVDSFYCTVLHVMPGVDRISLCMRYEKEM